MIGRTRLHEMAWSENEKRELVRLRAMHGPNWSVIAKQMPCRSAKQCREHYIYYLLPTMRRDVWSTHEDRRLLALHRIFGSKWSLIATYITGRPPLCIRNRCNILLRRQQKDAHAITRVTRLWEDLRDLSQLDDSALDDISVGADAALLFDAHLA